MHLLAHVEDVLAFLLENTVHLGVVGDSDVLLDVRLRRGEAELDQPDLCVRNLGRPASSVRRL